MAASGTAGDKSSGSTGFLIVLALLTIAAAGSGYGLVRFMGIAELARSGRVADAGKSSDAGSGKGGHGAAHVTRSDAAVPKASVAALDPIIVTLASPEARTMRIEAFVVFSSPLKDDQPTLLKQMTDDMTNFLRTVSLSQIDTPAGFELLREDLSELVQIRSKGAANGILLKGAMVE